MSILAGTAVMLMAAFVIVLAIVNKPPSTTDSGARETDAAQTSIASSPTPSHAPTTTTYIDATAVAVSSATADAPITANDQWTPVTQTFDGIDMVLVPKGCFDMGNDPAAYYWDGSASVHGVPDGGEQCFDTPFWIDRTEVTNAQYGSSGKFSGDTLPRENVNWSDAKAFCEKRGARLPTEAEWEYAARGPSDWFYPLGNDFVFDNFVFYANSNSQTAPVGSKPGGISWVGTLGMSGNVSEWVSTIYDQNQFPYPYATDDGREDMSRTEFERGLRGGSWFSPYEYVLSAAYRYRLNPSDESYLVGFRCARDY